MRLANTVPKVSTTSGDIVYANQEWNWRATVSETGVENLFRVDVEVGLATSDVLSGNATGFIGEPIPPGLSNNAWISASQHFGATT